MAGYVCKRSFVIGAVLVVPALAYAGIQAGSKSAVIKPFGMWAHSQPPPRNKTFVVADARVELAANQVCGYTDWSTSAIRIPKELLTGRYWKGKAESLRNEAIDSVLAVSGALPGMLVCNASPTFCHIMNQAKVAAQAELSFTVDSCKALDEVASSRSLVTEVLYECMRQKVAEDPTGNMSSREARMSCIHEDKLANSRMEKFRNVGRDIKKAIYSSEWLTKKVCRPESDQRYKYSTYSYSTSKASCDLFKEIFPGVELHAAASVSRGGSYQPVAKKMFTKEVRKSGSYIAELLSLMHSIRYGRDGYQNLGPMPREKVLSHKDVLEKLGVSGSGKLKALCSRKEANKCIPDTTKIPPIYRLSDDGSDPAAVILPETIYELVEYVGPSRTVEQLMSYKPSRLKMLIEQITQPAAYVKIDSILSTAISQTIGSCASDPELGGRAAQKDCETRIRLLKNEHNALASKRQTERDYLVSQLEFYREVERAKSQMLASPMESNKSLRKSGKLIHPQHIR